MWKIEDEIRLCEKSSEFKDKFIQLARDVYFTNDKRSKTKLEINKILNSNIKEIKLYTEYWLLFGIIEFFFKKFNKIMNNKRH